MTTRHISDKADSENGHSDSTLTTRLIMAMATALYSYSSDVDRVNFTSLPNLPLHLFLGAFSGTCIFSTYTDSRDVYLPVSDRVSKPTRAHFQQKITILQFSFHWQQTEYFF